jgi:uncharacterized protein (DUF58 family)
VLGEATFTVVVLILLVAVVLREPLLFLVALTLLLAAAASRLWARYCLARVEYRRQLSQRRAFFGEEVELTVEVANRKVLPLAWLEVEDELPRALAPAIGRTVPSHKVGRALLANLLALRPYERVRRHYHIRCDARGEHRFGPAILRSGDVFGFETREQLLEGNDDLLVYPRIVPVTQLGLPARDPLGERAARDWLFEDPLRAVGVREYAPGDSPRRIEWKASARTGALQVKLLEPSTTRRLVVALNLNTIGPSWSISYQPDLVELLISVAASIANWAVEDGYQVGLVGNAYTSQTGALLRSPPSRDPDQLIHVLEALARALPFASVSYGSLLRDEARKLRHGATIVLVTASLDDEAAQEIGRLRATGHRPVVLLAGDGPTPHLPGLTVHRVGDTAGWRELAGIGTS